MIAPAGRWMAGQFHAAVGAFPVIAEIDGLRLDPTTDLWADWGLLDGPDPDRATTPGQALLVCDFIRSAFPSVQFQRLSELLIERLQRMADRQLTHPTASWSSSTPTPAPPHCPSDSSTPEPLAADPGSSTSTIHSWNSRGYGIPFMKLAHLVRGGEAACGRHSMREPATPQSLHVLLQFS